MWYKGGKRVDTIAIFDLDGTLTRRDTLLPWLVQMQPCGSLVWHLPYYLYQYAAYRLSGGAADRYKERIIGTVVRGWSYEEGVLRGAAFADQIDQMLRHEAVRRLEQHQRDGHQTVLLTASTDLAVSSWAMRWGFDLVLSTELELAEGVYTGRFATPNCKGAEKVRRLDLALPEWRTVTTYGYGDSASDRDFLALCTKHYYGTFD